MIPSCITLTTAQKEKFELFKLFATDYFAKNPFMAEESEVTMASPFSWNIFATGLGDNIEVNFAGFWCCLTIDDDGELINTDEDFRWMKGEN